MGGWRRERREAYRRKMFDTISRPRSRRPAAGTAVSLALHTLAIGGAVWFTAKQIQTPVSTDPVVKFIPEPKGAPPPGPRGPSSPPKHTTKPPRPSLAQPTVPPAEPPAPVVEPPVTAEAQDDAESQSERPGSIGAGGNPFGSIDGIKGGTGGFGESVEPQPFEEGRMTPPARLSGPDPAYTTPALEHEVEGRMAVRCVVTEQGIVHGCRVIKSLPYMDAAVIQALEQRRYSPARINGQPVAVDYLFQIYLRLPAQ